MATAHGVLRSVTKAVECAVALQRAFADREGEPLSVRVGLNAVGANRRETGDRFGATVILARGIGGEGGWRGDPRTRIQCGVVLRKRLLFADRGEFVAKVFEEPIRVYE